MDNNKITNWTQVGPVRLGLVGIVPADMYRMVNVLRDYSVILKREGHYSHAIRYIAHAEALDAAPREGGLILAERFDVDAAQAATIGLLVDAQDRAEAARRTAAEAEAEARSLEEFVTHFGS